MGILKKIIFVTSLLLFVPINLFSIDMNGLKAYPVPFNPKKGVLKIDHPTLTGTFSAKLEVFDINSDKVCVRNYSTFTAVAGIVWNGRNDRGEFVKPGMYILKLTLEGNSTGADAGAYAKKIIKIVVKY